MVVRSNSSTINIALDELRSKRHKFICLNDNMDHSLPDTKMTVKALQQVPSPHSRPPPSSAASSLGRHALSSCSNVWGPAWCGGFFFQCLPDPPTIESEISSVEGILLTLVF